MRITVLHVKLLHTIIFVILSGCVLYVLFSGAFNRVDLFTWIAAAAVVIEGIVLALSGWQCPLTAVAERLGAVDGSVADIFLPRWFADRLFPICTTLFVIGCILVAFRIVNQ
jgi:hypothetical protein